MEENNKSKKGIRRYVFLLLLVFVIGVVIFEIDQYDMLDRYASFVTKPEQKQLIKEQKEVSLTKKAEIYPQKCKKIDTKMLNNYLDIVKNISNLHIKFLKSINPDLELKFLSPYIDVNLARDIQQYANKNFKDYELNDIDLNKTMLGKILQKFVTIKKSNFNNYQDEAEYKELEKKIVMLKEEIFLRDITNKITIQE